MAGDIHTDPSCKRDWSLLIENAERTGWLAVHGKASTRGGIEIIVRTPHGPTVPLDLESLPDVLLFFRRAQALIEQDTARLGERNSTLHAVRHVARQLVEALDAGEIDVVRSTLESYALPGEGQS